MYYACILIENRYSLNQTSSLFMKTQQLNNSSLFQDPNIQPARNYSVFRIVQTH